MYSNSALYRQLLKEHSQEEVDMIFREELKKRNVSIKNYVDFLENHERDYTKDTITKYVDLASFFQLDIQDAFSRYIFDNYILKCKYLDLICNYHCIQHVIEELCKNPNQLNDEQLLYISSYIDIQELNLEYTTVSNEGLQKCINLRKLNAWNNSKITNCDVFSHCLIDLNASFLCGISDEGIKKCCNLQILKAYNNKKITNCDAFSHSLMDLDASYDCGIDNKGLQNCINIQKLNARHNYKITTCEPFSKSLIELNASGNCGINNDGVKKCINLRKLIACDGSLITTCESFAQSLIELNASLLNISHHYRNRIGNYGIKNCINLQKLDASGNWDISTCEPFCKSLIELNASYDCYIGDKGIQNCIKLQKLNSHGNKKITKKIENKDYL